jgi:orotidine-5'-phosphate decarboxylase
VALAKELRGTVTTVKVGTQLFTAEGPQAVRTLAGLGFSVFLDLKFHDIPNTVSGAVSSAAKLRGVRLLTIHAAGGLRMMRAAKQAIGSGKTRLILLGVTVLTSLDAPTLNQVGFTGTPLERAVGLAQLAQQAGLEGIVTSAQEVEAVRRACGPKIQIVVPGLRPASVEADDQARVATPEAAIRAGADYLVIGRPITEAKDPRSVAKQIVAEIAAVATRASAAA